MKPSNTLFTSDRMGVQAVG